MRTAHFPKRYCRIAEFCRQKYIARSLRFESPFDIDARLWDRFHPTKRTYGSKLITRLIHRYSHPRDRTYRCKSLRKRPIPKRNDYRNADSEWILSEIYPLSGVTNTRASGGHKNGQSSFDSTPTLDSQKSRWKDAINRIDRSVSRNRVPYRV